jgi:hypothetical protein
MPSPKVITQTAPHLGEHFVSSSDDIPVVFEEKPGVQGNLILALQRLIEWGNGK